MKPQPVPEGLEWEGLPTIDELKEQSGIKIAQLRLLLAPVTCFKCPDNRVRYDELAAAEAISGASVDDDDEQIATFKADGGMSLVFHVLNKVLAILGAMGREKNETIKAMGEPLRAGVELLVKEAGELRKRTGELEENRDKVFRLIEDALSARNDREIKAEREKASIAIRKDLVDTLKGQVPSIVQKWGLTQRASMALDFLGSLDPRVVDGVIASGVLDAKQMAILEQLRVTLPAKDSDPATSSPGEPPAEESKPNGGEQPSDSARSDAS